MKISNLYNTYGLDTEYPDLWSTVVHVETKREDGLLETRSENQTWRAMHELWLARANKPKR